MKSTPPTLSSDCWLLDAAYRLHATCFGMCFVLACQMIDKAPGKQWSSKCQAAEMWLTLVWQLLVNVCQLIAKHLASIKYTPSNLHAIDRQHQVDGNCLMELDQLVVHPIKLNSNKQYWPFQKVWKEEIDQPYKANPDWPPPATCISIILTVSLCDTSR